MEAHIQNPKHSTQETTHIDFYQAMQDFKIMFPSMDDDVIEEVLRSNHGAVDATIDQLLAMSTDNINEALRCDLENKERMANASKIGDGLEPPDVTKGATGSGNGSGNGSVSGSGSGSFVQAKKKWSPPLLGPLPPTFLRIVPVAQKSYPDYSEDERIALFLQNEEFLSELQVNQDFLSTLDPVLGEKGSTTSDSEFFKERLRNMGKMSRSKFAQLSRVFQRRKKNRSVKGILDQENSPDSMLLSGEPLLSDGQDEPVHKK